MNLRFNEVEGAKDVEESVFNGDAVCLELLCLIPSPSPYYLVNLDFFDTVSFGVHVESAVFTQTLPVVCVLVQMYLDHLVSSG